MRWRLSDLELLEECRIQARVNSNVQGLFLFFFFLLRHGLIGIPADALRRQSSPGPEFWVASLRW